MASKKTKWIPRVGDKVTVKEPQEAYGSREQHRMGRDRIFLQPGEIGIIGSVNVPAVVAPVLWVEGRKTYPRGRNPVFHCVDFGTPDKWGNLHRTGCYQDEMILVEAAS